MPKLSTFIGGAFEISDPSDSWLHVIKSDGVGGYVSHVIPYLDFVSLLEADITAIEGQIGVKREDINQSSDQDFDLPVGSRLVSFTIQNVSGTVNLDVGTTAGGTDILEGYDITSGAEYIELNMIFEGADHIYVTRNSGTYNLITYYIPGWL